MKHFLKILVFYVVLVTVICRESRIIGGNLAEEGQFPFIAAVHVEKINFRIFCGGALLNEEWVLTSGLCTYETTAAGVSVGSHLRIDRDHNRVARESARRITHPDFNEDTLANDIGLIQLDGPIQYTDFIQPIKLPTINLPDILQPLALGWGQIAQDDEDYAYSLNFVELNILSNDECKMTYGLQILDSMVCLRGSTNEGTCYGDSGSPLVVRPIGSSVLELAGISSFFSGNGCEGTDPSGFTRTYPYVEWVKNITGIQ